MIYCDSHIHVARCRSLISFDDEYFCVSSCHTKDDFYFLEKIDEKPSRKYFASFGIHPQAVLGKRYSQDDFDFLEKLVSEKKIAAIGEIGLDFFTPELKGKADDQVEIFEKQLNLAIKNNLPVVLHLRKSVEKIFTYSKLLSKLPSVIFHSFPGTAMEAKSLLDHKVNGFFSFGKPVLNGRKHSIECVKNLPPDRILLETDAPYQTLKNEDFTNPDDIKKVYAEAASLKNMDEEEVSEKVFENFKKAYLISKTQPPRHNQRTF